MAELRDPAQMRHREKGGDTHIIGGIQSYLEQTAEQTDVQRVRTPDFSPTRQPHGGGRHTQVGDKGVTNRTRLCGVKSSPITEIINSPPILTLRSWTALRRAQETIRLALRAAVPSCTEQVVAGESQNVFRTALLVFRWFFGARGFFFGGFTARFRGFARGKNGGRCFFYWVCCCLFLGRGAPGLFCCCFF